MATSITQAKPLLTASELELFEQSRASPIKALTGKQLAGKEKRVRALRDKYRDLYRRQTLARRGKGGKSPVSSEDANARTQRKADIMQEVLERFEARSAQVSAREEREAAQTASRKPAAKAPAKSVKKSAGAGASKPAARSKQTGAKAAGPASKKSTGKTSAQKPAAKQPASKKPVSKAKPATAQKPAAKQPASKKPVSKAKPATLQPELAARSASRTSPALKRKPKDTEHAISALAHLQDGEGAVHIDHFTGQDPTLRSTKAPSERAPTYGGKAQAPDVNAPLDMVASAKRGNPVRQMPGNIAIQGHQSSAVRRAQGKRDSR